MSDADNMTDNRSELRTNCGQAKRQKIDRPWRDYPIGTKAHACNGGYWLKMHHGWKWNGPDGSGSTFPTPGGDACGRCVELPDQPEADPYEREAAKAAIKVLQRELSEAREEISDLQGDVEAWKRETMIVNARLRGEKHPDDNGAISTKEIIPKLQRELAEARSMTEGQWLLKVAARLVTAGCKSDGIVDAMDELIQQRDTLAEALEMVTTHNPVDNQCDNGYSPRYVAKQALAAVKGGSDD